jgi:hypothetical protein
MLQLDKRQVKNVGNRDKLLDHLVSLCGDLLSAVGRCQIDADAGMDLASGDVGRLLAVIDALKPHLNVGELEQARESASSTYLATGQFISTWISRNG